MSKIDVNETHKTRNINDIDANGLGVRRRGQRRRVCTVQRRPSLTVQADRDRANIHNILDRYKKSGHLPQVVAQPLEGEVSAPADFMEAMNLVAAVNSQFEQLPVKIRQRFGYRPENLLQYAQDPENHADLVKLGLAIPPQPAPQEPAPAPAAAPTAQAEGAGAPPAGGQ